MRVSSNLSLEQTPPLHVPLRLFLVAPWFGVAAGLVLAATGTSAVASRWTPAALALTHLIALGWLGMAMLGALLQVLPIVVGCRVPGSTWLSRLVAPALAVGVSALAGGMLGGPPALFHLAALLLAVALLPPVSLMLWALARQRLTADTPRGVGGAVVALAVTIVLGATLLAGWAWPQHVPLPRYRLTNIHALWATCGWVALLVVAMSYQVVPMFQMTPEYPALMKRWLAPVLLGTLTSWTIARLATSEHELGQLLDGAVVFILSVGLATYAVRTLVQQRQRRRRVYDSTVHFWQLGMVMLLTAAISLLAAAFTPLGDHPRAAWWLGTTFLVGFAGSVVAGMQYKIVPFLAWLHLQNRYLSAEQRPAYKLPAMKAFVPERASRVHLVAHVTSVVLLMATALEPRAAAAAGLGFALTSCLQGANLVRMAARARTQRRTLERCFSSS